MHNGSRKGLHEVKLNYVRGRRFTSGIRRNQSGAKNVFERRTYGAKACSSRCVLSSQNFSKIASEMDPKPSQISSKSHLKWGLPQGRDNDLSRDAKERQCNFFWPVFKFWEVPFWPWSGASGAKAPFWEPPGPPKIDQKSIKTRVREKHEIHH